MYIEYEHKSEKYQSLEESENGLIKDIFPPAIEIL